MNEPLSTDRLDQLLLARLAATPVPRPAALLDAVRRFWPTAVHETVQDGLRRLESNGLVAENKITEAGQRVREFGVAGGPWQRIAESVLPLQALGWSVDDPLVRKRLDGREAWAAAILAREYGLVAAGQPPPTPSEVGKLIVWRRLGLAGKLPQNVPGAITALILARLLGSDVTDWRRGLFFLAARSAGALRADLRALRDGVVAAWLGGRSWTEPRQPLAADAAVARVAQAAQPAQPTQPAQPARPAEPPAEPTTPPADDLEGFARQVRDAARRASSGVFGDRKVFISALWRDLDDNGGAGVSLDEFKQRLVEANRRGLLRLYRADLVAEMDPTEVAASATRFMDATFHFVERETTP
jgi:hypothetical protein